MNRDLLRAYSMGDGSKWFTCTETRACFGTRARSHSERDTPKPVYVTVYKGSKMLGNKACDRHGLPQKSTTSLS